jgi:hypothetical protein
MNIPLTQNFVENNQCDITLKNELKNNDVIKTEIILPERNKFL